MSDAWFVAPRELRFIEQRAFGEASVGQVPIRQVWTQRPDEEGRAQYDVAEFESLPTGERLREAWRVAVGDDGVWHLGPIDASGAVSRWSPPLMLLPGTVAPCAFPGQLHHREDKEVERGLDVLEGAVFARSVAAVSDTRAPGVRILWRDHYVQGVGWVGFEGMILRPTGQMRIWSEAVTRDGAPAPLPVEDADA